MKKVLWILPLFFVLTACRPEVNTNARTKAVDGFLDNWHNAAARADSEVYFGGIAEDGVYIGTDKSEVWTKQEFFDWSKPYFDKGRAWTFVGKNRSIYFSKDGNIAWFDELATSKSGEWRGSGVLEMGPDGWKIKQYVLSMTVPNDLMKTVTEAIKKYEADSLK
jgi:SnoaL-like domain